MAITRFRLFDALEDYGSCPPALDAVPKQDARIYAEPVDRASRIDEVEKDHDSGARDELSARIKNRIAWLVLGRIETL